MLWYRFGVEERWGPAGHELRSRREISYDMFAENHLFKMRAGLGPIPISRGSIVEDSLRDGHGTSVPALSRAENPRANLLFPKERFAHGTWCTL